MITFFRKIRRQLIPQNSFSKYLLYAFGEVVLVIIGILIALQINNWNENRKADNLSKEMISEIKSGIESDLEELNRMIFFQKSVLNSQNLVADWLKSETDFEDSLSTHISKTYMSTDYSVNYSGYETLKKFGLRRINNDSLRLSIASLYEKNYPRFIKFSTIYQSFLEELLSNNSKHFNGLNYLNRTRMRPLNDKKIKNDQDYIYSLNTLRNFNQLLILQSSILKKEMEKTYSIFN